MGFLQNGGIAHVWASPPLFPIMNPSPPPPPPPLAPRQTQREREMKEGDCRSAGGPLLLHRDKAYVGIA